MDPANEKSPQHYVEDLMKIQGGSPAHMLMLNAGHQMRAPLSNMFSALNLLSARLGSALDDASLRYLATLQQNCFRLMRLSNNLVDLPRLETGQTSLDIREMEFRAFAGGVVRKTAEVARGKNVALEFICQEDAISLQGDAVLLERMLYNLLSNAVKFSASGGTVTFSVSRLGGDAVLRVSGAEHGETELDLDALCRLYERKLLLGADNGMGLGLRLSRLIAEAHGGALRVFAQGAQPERFEALTVYVTLPLRQNTDIATLGTMVYDYAGEFSHELLELSDAVPSGKPIYRP